LQWLREEGCPWDWHVLHYARMASHKPVLKWAEENGCTMNGFREEEGGYVFHTKPKPLQNS